MQIPDYQHKQSTNTPVILLAVIIMALFIIIFPGISLIVRDIIS